MSGNITFTIIKPDAVRNGHSGKIIDQITEAGFRVKAMKMVWLSDKTAGNFYDIHRERPFQGFGGVHDERPLHSNDLGKDNAVEDFRTLIGSTNPATAAEGTIRNRFAKSIDANAIHGLDSDENALREGAFFFSEMEMF